MPPREILLRRGLFFGTALALSPIPDEGNQPVWIQIAREGTFRGHPDHPQGVTFSRALFEGVVRNFRSQPAYMVGPDGVGINRVVPYDYEHASEMDPTQGTIPQSGAPAPAWATELDIRDSADGLAQLWALTLLGDKAREQIRSKEYQWTSVAIWPDMRDPDTNESIGPYLSSIAFTNHPFIRGMAPMAARWFVVDEEVLESAGQNQSGQLQANQRLEDQESNEMPTTNEPNNLTAKLATVLKVNPHDDLVLAAAEKTVQEAQETKSSLEQLMALFDSSDFQDLMSKASESIKRAQEAEPLVAALAAARERLGKVDEAEAEAETEAVVASLKLDPETAKRIKPIIFDARKACIGDEAKLASFRQRYPLPDKDKMLLTQRVFAGPNGAQQTAAGQPVATEPTERDQALVKFSSMPGRNNTEKVVALLSSEESGFDKLDRLTQIKRAGEWRRAHGI